jgi:hypothetical protein
MQDQPGYSLVSVNWFTYDTAVYRRPGRFGRDTAGEFERLRGRGIVADVCGGRGPALKGCLSSMARISSQVRSDFNTPIFSSVVMELSSNFGDFHGFKPSDAPLKGRTRNKEMVRDCRILEDVPIELGGILRRFAPDQ